MKKYLMLLTAALFCANTSLASGCEHPFGDTREVVEAGSSPVKLVGRGAPLNFMLPSAGSCEGDMCGCPSTRPSHNTFKLIATDENVIIQPVFLDDTKAWNRHRVLKITTVDGVDKLRINEDTAVGFTFNKIVDKVEEYGAAVTASIHLMVLRTAFSDGTADRNIAFFLPTGTAEEVDGFFKIA